MHCAQKTAKNGKNRRFFILLRFLKIENGREPAAKVFVAAKHLGRREKRIFDFFRSNSEFGGIFE
jgi:hypothetical protein